MKTIIRTTAITIIATLTACTSGDNIPEPAREEVQLCCTTPEPEVTVTRASLASESLTDLWIWEGTTLIKHQEQGDDNFGSPLLSLDYGTHQLTIVASKSTTQTWSQGVWTTNSAKDCYGQTLTLEVKKGMTAQDVELTRLTSKVMWTIEDVLPATCTTASCSVGSYTSLTAALAGANAYTLSNDFNIISWQNTKNLAISMSIFPAVWGSESKTQTSITLKDASGNTLVKYEKEVPILSNRVTNIHGEYFGTQGTGGITISTDWIEQLDVEL